MKPSLICMAGMSLLGCASGLGQTPATAKVTERLDAVVQSYTANQAFMGTVLVAQGDQVLLDKGYGMADLEWEIPNTPEVKFRLGSLSKHPPAEPVALGMGAPQRG